MRTSLHRLLAVLGVWACPNCGCLNDDGHVSCGFC